MLIPLTEVEELDASVGPARGHVDPRLAGGRCLYVSLVKRLLKVGMVWMSQTRRCDVGLFCVWRRLGM